LRVLVAGATGAIGRRLVPQLLAAGHQVTGTTRSPQRVDELRAAGAEPLTCDALDAEGLRAAVVRASPEAVIHQLTALPQRVDPRRMRRDLALNDRLRSEGTRNLVAAAQAAGAARIIAQSIAFAYAPGPPGTLHGEDDPLFLNAPRSFRRSARAVAELETTVLAAGGVVLRYGFFYGPGSAFAQLGSMAEEVRRRRLPIVGRGTGVFSFIHIDDAAGATVIALERGGNRAYNIVDDDPAPVSEWLPAFAQAVGAAKPLRVPELIARIVAGSYGVATMTRAQGASNALARRELAFEPTYPSWRDGFATGL
jgi:nucleoside-diphosphate-sugar epimerase